MTPLVYPPRSARVHTELASIASGVPQASSRHAHLVVKRRHESGLLLILVRLRA